MNPNSAPMKFFLYFLLTCFLLLMSCSSDDSTTETIADPTIANKQATGSSSNDLLSDENFTSMVIELVYVEGFEPSQSAVNNFVSFLQARTFKPNGISVEKRAISSIGKNELSIADIVAIEEANRSQYTSENKIAVWAFFTDGEAESDTNNNVTLGSAYRNTSFVIYEETIVELSNRPFAPSRSVLESTAITHEFGHILGLVDLGAPLQSDHEDAANEKHCDVENCLMFFTAETGAGVMDMVSGGVVPQLDSQCIADLRANGGR